MILKDAVKFYGIYKMVWKLPEVGDLEALNFQTQTLIEAQSLI